MERSLKQRSERITKIYGKIIFLYSDNLQRALREDQYLDGYRETLLFSRDGRAACNGNKTLLDHPHTDTDALLFQHRLEVRSLHTNLFRRPGDVPVVAVKGTE